MKHLDLFAEFAEFVNQPATVAKFATVEKHIVDANKMVTPTVRKSRIVENHIPDPGKMVTPTIRITQSIEPQQTESTEKIETQRLWYAQHEKTLIVHDKKTNKHHEMQWRGLIYETLLENIYWRFKVIGKPNAHEFIIHQFMRTMLSESELLTEKKLIDDVIHSQCNDCNKCPHINEPTWSEHLNELVRHATHSD